MGFGSLRRFFMQHLEVYTPSLQSAVEDFFRSCMEALGWEYQPMGRHSDMVHIPETYMAHGAFWCLFEGDRLVGTVAVHCIDKERRIAEMKRLYVLPNDQGKGYGRTLFDWALRYARENGYSAIRLDTRQDRLQALHLIQAHGFRQIPKYNQNTFSELYYELPLIG